MMRSKAGRGSVSFSNSKFLLSRLRCECNVFLASIMRKINESFAANTQRTVSSGRSTRLRLSLGRTRVPYGARV